MIFKTITLFIVICLWNSVDGQIHKFEIGAEGGPSLISLRGNDILENFSEPAIGYIGGLTFQHNFSRHISIRTSISYERKGSVNKALATDINGSPIGNLTTHINYDYLTQPILVRFTFGDKSMFFVNAGPYYGYLIKQEMVTDEFNEFEGSTLNNIENDKLLDLGLSAGAGAALHISETLFMTLELRHNLGLYNVSKVPVINDGTIKTNSTNLLISMAHRFGVKVSQN